MLLFWSKILNCWMRNFRILFAKLAEHVMIACFLVKSLLSEIHESKDSSSFGIFPSRKFNETVSMDLKEIKGIKILHLVDNFTRFSVASKVNSKETSEIINVIFKAWIAYLGPPLNFIFMWNNRFIFKRGNRYTFKKGNRCIFTSKCKDYLS